MNTRSPRRVVRPATMVLLVLVLVLALVPLVHRSAGPLLPGPLDSIGTLTLLAEMMVIGALAMTLYLLIGVTGMLSFGHGLAFALSAYATVMLANRLDLPFLVAAVLAVVLTTVVCTATNALALRSGIIGFSMITLAFAELMALMVQQGYFGSGGDTGLTLDNDVIPGAFQGLANTNRSYWLALALVVVIYAAVRLVEGRTRLGRVLISIRENDLRSESMGFHVYGYKLASAVVASFLAAVCGVVYALLTSGAQPDLTLVTYSLGLVLMVILGGRGVVWGALLGGLLHTYLTLQLPTFAASDSVQSLPGFLRVPLSQPEFVLGVCFVLVILFLPGGIASGLQKARRSRASVHRGGEQGQSGESRTLQGVG